MRKRMDRAVSVLTGLLSLLSVFIMGFMLLFILRESLPAIREVGLRELLLGESWRPLSRENASFGLSHMILSTLYVSFLAILFSSVIGVGAALFIAMRFNAKGRTFLTPFIELLAGIPSVVYGFIGLAVVVKLFERLGRAAGESVLAGAIVLSVMLLPYIISSCCETMVRVKERYALSSGALGVSSWYMAANLVLPASGRGILISVALAVGRAMGETMAVMMVLGNSIAMPTLLGKGETLASLIALEMGAAEVGSTHFSALYTAGLFLMLLLLGIQLVFHFLQKKFIKEAA